MSIVIDSLSKTFLYIRTVLKDKKKITKQLYKHSVTPNEHAVTVILPYKWEYIKWKKVQNWYLP